MDLTNRLWQMLLAVSQGFQRAGLLRVRALREAAYAVIEALLPVTSTKCTTWLGFPLWVDPHSPLGRQLRLGLEYEGEVVRFLLKRVNRGDVVVDVGANVGYFTILLARLVGSTGKVVSFEPDPLNFEILLRNIGENHIANVHCEMMAVANRVGEMPLFKNPTQTTGHSLVRHFSEKRWTPVKVTTLDAYISEHKLSPKLVKVDAEGAESLVLEGMAETIRHNRGMCVLFEFAEAYLREMGSEPTDLLRILECYGLEVFTIERQGTLRPFEFCETRPEEHSSLLVAFNRLGSTTEAGGESGSVPFHPAPDTESESIGRPESPRVS